MARVPPINKALPWLPQHLAQMQKAMDDSKDVPEAIRKILLGVYLLGFNEGAASGYEEGERDGRTKPRAIAAE